MKQHGFWFALPLLVLAGCWDDKDSGEQTSQNTTKPETKAGCTTRATILKVDWPLNYEGQVFWNDVPVWSFPTSRQKQEEYKAYTVEDKLAKGIVWYKEWSSSEKEDVVLVLAKETILDANKVRATYKKYAEGKKNNPEIDLRVSGTCLDDIKTGYSATGFVVSDYDVQESGEVVLEVPKAKIPADYLK